MDFRMVSRALTALYRSTGSIVVAGLLVAGASTLPTASAQAADERNPSVAAPAGKDGSRSGASRSGSSSKSKASRSSSSSSRAASPQRSSSRSAASRPSRSNDHARSSRGASRSSASPSRGQRQTSARPVRPSHRAAPSRPTTRPNTPRYSRPGVTTSPSRSAHTRPRPHSSDRSHRGARGWDSSRYRYLNPSSRSRTPLTRSSPDTRWDTGVRTRSRTRTAPTPRFSPDARIVIPDRGRGRIVIPGRDTDRGRSRPGLRPDTRDVSPQRGAAAPTTHMRRPLLDVDRSPRRLMPDADRRGTDRNRGTARPDSGRDRGAGDRRGGRPEPPHEPGGDAGGDEGDWHHDDWYDDGDHHHGDHDHHHHHDHGAFHYPFHHYVHWHYWSPYKSKSVFSFAFSWHFGYDYIQPAVWCASPYWYHYETVWFSSPVYRTIYKPVYVTTLATVSKPRSVVAAGPVPCGYSEREAWTFLAEGHVEAAMGAFACLASQSPSDGMANVGYALANALAGADGAAVAAMRLAVTLDAAALLYVPADSRLDDAMVGLLSRYAAQAGDPGLAVDALFMMAAVRTALHDHANAHFAVAQAIERGDQHPSASILREILAQELHQTLYGRAPSP